MKRFLGLILTAAMLVGIFPSAYAEGYSYNIGSAQLWQDSDIYEVSADIFANGAAADKASAVIGFYDAENRLIAAVTESVSADDERLRKYVQIPDRNVKEARVFLWDSETGMTPVAEKAEITEIRQKQNQGANTGSGGGGGTASTRCIGFANKLGIMTSGGVSNTITRGEAAKMAVAMLGRQKVAETLKNETGLSDVEIGSELCGIANYCDQRGYLTADDGKFRPDDYITYGEFIKMMVEALGYHPFAEAEGGWPIGYLERADDVGIMEGVRLTLNSCVTKADAAQMIYNSALSPIVETTGVITDDNGKCYPVYEMQDGSSGRKYETWMTKQHKAYYVEGYVSNTYKTSSAINDKDEVQFTIEYTKNYDDNSVVINKGSYDGYGNALTAVESVYSDGAVDDEDLFRYASAIIQVTDNGAKIIEYKPSDKNCTAVLSADLMDEEDYKFNDTVFGSYASNRPYIKFYDTAESEKSTRYNLDRDFALYVNGVEVAPNRSNFERYVVNNNSGDIELLDRYSLNRNADGMYDVIFVNYYATAKVGNVSAESGRIVFDTAYNNDGQMSITINEDVNCVIDGAAAALETLKPGDVISIAYDVASGLPYSEFYDIRVSRDVISGMCTSLDDETETVGINGQLYKTVQNYGDIGGEIRIGDDYKFYLDTFGRVFDYEPTTNVNYAILDRYTKSSADDYYRATLYKADGTSFSAEVDTSKVTLTINGTTYKNGDVDTQIKRLVYANGENGAKTPIQNRVVKYKISSSGRITSLEIAYIERSAMDEPYKSSKNSVGNVVMDSNTKIIDASYYVDEMASGVIAGDSLLSAASLSQFVDGSEYSAFAYGDRSSSGTYPFVIVTGAGTALTSDPREQEPVLSARQYALIDGYTKSSADDYYRATLCKADGTSEKIEVDTSKAGLIVPEDICSESGTVILEKGTYRRDGVGAALKKLVYANGEYGERNPAQNRVISFVTNIRDDRIVSEINIVKPQAAVENAVFAGGKLGDYAIGANTIIVDGMYLLASFTKAAAFTDNETYTAYFYGEPDNNNAFPFMIVTDGSADLDIPDEPMEEQYAIIDKYTKSSADDYYKARLYNMDGITLDAEVDTSRVRLTIDGTTYKHSDVDTQIKKLVYTNRESGAKNPIENCVIKYRLGSETGRIISLELVPIESNVTNSEFNPNTNKIGTIRIDENTKVIDAIVYTETLLSGRIPTYNDLSMGSLKSFQEESNYTVYAYGEKNENGAYPYIIITSGGEYYNSKTHFAVVTKQPQQAINTDGDYIYKLKALYNGAETEFVVNEDAEVYGASGGSYKDVQNLQKGDIIVFVKDNNDNISVINVLVTASALGLDESYNKAAQNILSENPLNISTAYAKNWTTSWSMHDDNGSIDYSKPVTRLVCGPILSKKPRYFTLGSIGNASNMSVTDDRGNDVSYTGLYTDLSKTGGRGMAMDIEITDKTNVYVWDYSIENYTRQLKVGAAGLIVAATIPNSFMYNDREFIPWSNDGVRDGANFAFAKVVDDEATDVFVILSR